MRKFLESGVNIVTGCRIPKDYFVATGTGESDITIHAGSYHLALRKCGIEMCNIITYSSILPKIATEIEKPKQLVHGSVLESIMAVCHTKKGNRATVGIIYGWLHNRKTTEIFGGLVCEHNGDYSLEEIDALLQASIHELYINGFEEDYELKNKTIIKESLIPQKNFGTAIAALCFTSYLYPVIQ